MIKAHHPDPHPIATQCGEGDGRAARRLFISGGSSVIGGAIVALARARRWEVLAPSRNELDVSNQLAVRLYFKEAGPLDACVNAASFHLRAGLQEQPVDKTVNTILLGTFYCTREFTKWNPQGAVVNVSSEAARTGGYRLSAYAAAKAGVNALTLSLSRELAPAIRVNAVSLGVIDTVNNIAKDGATLPFGRKGLPQEVAYAVMWLLSDEASYVSGAVLPVAGAM